MKNQYTFLGIVGIFLFLAVASGLSATGYSGETVAINLSEEFDSISNYSVINNTEINLTVVNLTAYVSVPEDFTGQLKLYFEGYKTEEKVEKKVDVSSGGGSKGSYVAPNKPKTQNTTSNTVTNESQIPDKQEIISSQDENQEKSKFRLSKAQEYTAMFVLIVIILIIIIIKMAHIFTKLSSENKQ